MTPLVQLIPREPFGREDIQAFAEESGWTPVDVRQPDGPIEELAWVLGLADADSPEDTDDVETLVVHWIEDQRFQVDYLAVEGDSSEWFADSLRDALPLHSDESLLQMTANTRDDMALMRALRRMGIHCAGREYDAVSYDLLRWALHDPEPLVRRNALLAASLIGWPQLVPLLTAVIDTEKDLTVRQQAVTTLDVVRDLIDRQGSISSKGTE
ncbi:HEAT repeat domain-containing protein [Promicromonospora sp. NPDC057138]|uniref:HEAT repeat domain-containing protein n=1 Tax=Promicromonospora sp. NPDC057138 TaxID=3346031 RepID=UPI0036328B62